MSKADELKSKNENLFQRNTVLINQLEEKDRCISELIDLIHAERKRQEQCDDIHLKKIAELEQENAELKEKYDSCLRENTGLKIHSAFLEKKLTKAKEIIKEFLDFEASCMERGIYISDKIRAEAKQFLSEVEK